MDHEERMRENLQKLHETSERIRKGAAERGILRSPGESYDRPRGKSVIVLAETETYPEFIKQAGWVLVVYTCDENWPMNYSSRWLKDYYAPKPVYCIPQAALKAIRGFVKSKELVATLVDTSRAKASDINSIHWLPSIRLFRDGKEMATLEYKEGRRGSGDAGQKVKAWIEDQLSKFEVKFVDLPGLGETPAEEAEYFIEHADIHPDPIILDPPPDSTPP